MLNFTHYSVQFSSVQSLSHVRLFVIPWTVVCQDSLSITSSQTLLKLMSIKLMMSSNHIIFHCPLLLPPSIFPSIRAFSNESALHISWPKYWSFSYRISPSNEKSGLISFRMSWFDLFAFQGTLKSLRQHHSSKASVLPCSLLYSPTHIHTWLQENPKLSLLEKYKSKPKWGIISRWSESVQFSSVQSLSRVRLLAIPWITAHQASLSITNSRNSLRLTSIESVIPSSCLILCRPLLLQPPIPPSIRVFSNESTLRMR